MSNALDLTITKTIPASREDVFKAWLDPEALAKFMQPMDGMSVPKAESDARVGGSFLIVMQAGDKELPHSGTYKEVSEFERLVFTWVSPNSQQEDSTVTLTFADAGSNTTELTLHHVGFASEESRNNHKGGWTAIVEKLAHVVA